MTFKASSDVPWLRQFLSAWSDWAHLVIMTPLTCSLIERWYAIWNKKRIRYFSEDGHSQLHRLCSHHGGEHPSEFPLPSLCRGLLSSLRAWHRLHVSPANAVYNLLATARRAGRSEAVTFVAASRSAFKTSFAWAQYRPVSFIARLICHALAARTLHHAPRLTACIAWSILVVHVAMTPALARIGRDSCNAYLEPSNTLHTRHNAQQKWRN